MRLGIDLDGVVADFNAGWIGLYNEQFGTSIHPDAVTSWNAMYKIAHFRSMDAFWDWAREVSLFRNLPTYDGAVDAMWKLAYNGHKLVILTSKPNWAVHDTYAWISDNQLPTREVHILDRKWSVECDVYLDDAPHQVYRINRARPQATVCRYVRPWNEPVEGAFDVRDWAEFIDLVESLADAGH